MSLLLDGIDEHQFYFRPAPLIVGFIFLGGVTLELGGSGLGYAEWDVAAQRPAEGVRGFKGGLYAPLYITSKVSSKIIFRSRLSKTFDTTTPALRRRHPNEPSAKRILPLFRRMPPL